MSNAETVTGDPLAPTRRPRRRGGPRLGLLLAASEVRDAVGRLVSLGAAPHVIERVSGKGSPAEDRWMSRRHATVTPRPDGGGVFVQDGAMGDEGHKPSANGTFVGEVPATGPVQVAPGQTFRTGSSLWLLVVDAQRAGADSLLVGISPAMDRARDEVALICGQVAARLQRGRRVTQSLLVLGPRGTGKQVVAREAHRLLGERRGTNKQTPFRQVSAPTMADGTGAADLFGVVDRYATDVRARPGYFLQANGGVLFLDEIADLPAAEQAKLLNVLQEREVTPLGGQRAEPFDCLVIAATNAPLQQAVDRGSFRADLYDRLARYVVSLPSLAERREDIPLLAHALLERHGFDGGVSAPAMEALLTRAWPGNVRQLDALMERLAAVGQAERLTQLRLDDYESAVAGLPAAPPIATPNAPDVASADAAPLTRGARPPRDELLAVLDACGWNKSEAGRRYGRAARQITRWMEYLNIQRP